MKSLIGVWIRRERLKKNYSQEGLCKGICVVSYLSKIEQGKVEAGIDILKALLNRLEINYETEETFLQRAEKNINKLYEYLYEGIFSNDSMEEIKAEKNRYLCSDYMLDVLLFSKMFSNALEEELKDYISCMNERQYELYLYLECREKREDFNKLLFHNSNGFYLYQAGYHQWREGNYLKAIELLNHSYLVSCQEGTVYNMLFAKIILGNCYCSMQNKELMIEHYNIAKRIAKAMQGQEEQIEQINYNIASTFLQFGEVKEALNYFKMCNHKSALYYHKYAICMERLGNKKEAKRALEKGRKEILREVQEEYDSCYKVYEALFHQMFDIVEYRLNHQEYLKESAYEQLLNNCMKEMKRLLPKGFQEFHAVYVKELLECQRKYKEVCLLIKEFSI